MAYDENFIRTLNAAEIAKLIEKNDKLYWKLGEPEISDEEYDLLVRALFKLDPEHPILSKVSAPAVAASGKVRHKEPMLSLDKAYSLEELITWGTKFARTPEERLLVQPKYDGISAIFAEGVLATRGDGSIGENISDKISLIELEAKNYIGPLDRPARGEIVIRNDDFKNIYSKITKKDGNHYKNPRNAVAGIMGLKKIDEMVQQGAKLTLVDYDLVAYSSTLANFEENWPKFVENIENLPYPMDGIVVKLADEAYATSLGATAHHPRGAIAFKFSGVRKEAKLLDVEWSFGKNCLTPVALLEPVDIGGVSIKRASLHNIQNIIDRDIHIGDLVIVERAGDVIPHIVDAKPGKERRSCMITECPSCGATLVRIGPEISCANPHCPETLVRRLLASIRSIGIDRLGEPNVRRMMETLNVKTLKDIFELSINDILKLEGFKDKSAANLYNEIQSARTVDDFQVVAALNIRGIGANVAKSILEHHSLNELKTLSVEELSAIDGVGPERAEALFRELREQSDFLDELLGVVKVNQTKGTGASSAPTVCFTGKMPEKRSFYANLAKTRGFEPSDSVSSSLALLVANDPSAGGGKLAKAAKLDVRIVALDDWMNSAEFASATAFAGTTPLVESTTTEIERTSIVPTQTPTRSNAQSSNDGEYLEFEKASGVSEPVTETPHTKEPSLFDQPESLPLQTDSPEMEEPFLPGF
jgi:DNA ligase (NAD+)